MSTELQIQTVLDTLHQKSITHAEAKKLLLEANVIDPDTQIELHMAATKALLHYNVLKQVQSVHNNFVTSANSISTAKVHDISKKPIYKMTPVKWGLRIAASVTLILSTFFIYQYSTNSSAKLYSEIYQPYNVNTDRGMGEIITHNMVNEYKNKDYKAVIKTFESLPVSNSREKFLAAYSYHEIGSYKQSLITFQQLLEANKKSGSLLYNDEAEFYIGLVYLKLKDPKSAALSFEKIQQNPNHTFYERVSKKVITRLKWLY